MNPEVHRLFFALWPDDALRARLSDCARQLRQRLHPEGRWTGAHRYHLTLHFLGDYPEYPEALAQRATAVAAATRSPPFRLRIDQAGSFRNRSIPWWLGASAPPPELRLLWSRLRDEMRSANLPYDAKLRFAPHLTILRDARQPLAATPIPAVDWPVGDFVLLHSVIGPRFEYRIVGRWPLSGAPDAAETQRDLWENEDSQTGSPAT